MGLSLDIAPPAREVLEEARMRYEPTAGDMLPHVTVLPPIDVDDDAMPAVLAHLESVARATAPFTLALAGTGTFRPVSPVVFVALREGGEQCAALESRARSGDMAVETRFPYHPHVTIAHDVAPALLDRAEADLAGFEATMLMASMALYENRDGQWDLLRVFDFEG
ncbi:MAG: 2'-5' RNA ligase family protein [Candidatus Nanopelagicales bacterium]